MKHVTYGEKSHFLGDDAATALIEYASALGNAARSATVTMEAVDEHGNTVDATFLLNPSTVLLIETSSSDLAEPDNTAAVDAVRGEIDRLRHPREIEPEEHPPPPVGGLHDSGC